ncbi:MAG: IPT/TIG domain-containing protein [Ignavibacteriales bacterium]|nr:IPT/TIG domain-containing protein [Ignavibacteriales bacterium]
MRLHVCALSTFIVLAGMALACKDAGTEPPQPPALAPSIMQIVPPDSAAVGDTLRVTGSSFGSSQSSSTLTIGGVLASTIISWTDTEIRAEVPLLAATDSVRVVVGGKNSGGVRFKSATVRFATLSQQVFLVSCSCHGGANNLFVDTYANIMKGNSTNGPVVSAGNGEGSVIVKKLRGTASFGGRMPQGGPYLGNALINKVSTWIQQGARNN